MISPYPIKLYKYLGSKRNKIPRHMGRLFYMSYEDALWDILKKKRIKKGSRILVPEFWCGDVEKNIRAHGYEIVHYPISKHLKVNVRDLISILRKDKPEIVIVFHPFGIRSNLFENTSWTKSLGKDSILIEDCVHKIVDPEKIIFLTERHLVIDSLRKVMPLQGSVVYGKKEFLDFKPDIINGSWLYSIKVVYYWAMMQMYLTLGQVGLAIKYMDTGYSLIGDSKDGAGGWTVFDCLHRFVDFSRVKKIKEKQVMLYEKTLLKKYRMIHNHEDRGELRSFPVILDLYKAKRLVFKAKSRGLVLKFELNDSIWSRSYKAVGLPLGLHLGDREVSEVAEIINEAIK